MKNPTWKIINIGHLRKNQFWDEENDRRDQVCTSILIEADARRILVDPGLPSTEMFQTLLDQRSGYQPQDIDTIFLTHFHRNHWRSLALFRKSVWLMSRTEIRWRQRKQETSEEEKNILARIVPIEEHSLPGIEILSTPGHTHGSASLMFETREGVVIAAGDAVLTFDHFEFREPSEHAEDRKEARCAIDRIAKIADVVIPGHDNYFVI
ncbi:MAG: MBL fold metallo-hydrolase [Candidatus Omnitrophota bacterium]|jgi:glyoxylase-like metal-dependent hydrolase (beta-lactamase superfamily II)|nr:MAG: MBL fold metallo-hydrolase [Candidatus Omnitrophota bacterium]